MKIKFLLSKIYIVHKFDIKLPPRVSNNYFSPNELKFHFFEILTLPSCYLSLSLSLAPDYMADVSFASYLGLNSFCVLSD